MEDLIALNGARSKLVLLLSTCNQTLLALEAAGNELDTDMTDDLRLMVDRTKEEIEALNLIDRTNQEIEALTDQLVPQPT
jgi:hypothetical protein